MCPVQIPGEAVMAAATAIERELLSGKDYSMAQDSDEALARVALEAAAPILAGAWGVLREGERRRSDGYALKVHLRLESGAGLSRCGLGGRSPGLTDDRAEVTCAACAQGWRARTDAELTPEVPDVL